LKSPSPPSPPPNSPKRAMQIISATLQPIQIKATYMNVTQYIPSTPTTSNLKKLFFKFSSTPVVPPSTSSLSNMTTAIAFLRVATAQTKISISQKFGQEFQRAQKKFPPTNTRISILCISKQEFDASTSNNPIFRGLIPLEQGRMYIGFPLIQTTGLVALYA